MQTSPSYVHKQTKGGWALGFSAFLGRGFGTEEDNDLRCNFALTFCNPEDKNFSRAEARNQLIEKMTVGNKQEVKVRDVPKLLAEAQLKAEGHKASDFGEFYTLALKELTNHYNYVLRRFV